MLNVEQFPSGTSTQWESAFPHEPEQLRKVLNHQQTWAGLANNFGGQLVDFQASSSDDVLSVEAVLVIPTDWMRPSDRRIVGPSLSMACRVNWGFDPEGEQASERDGRNPQPLVLVSSLVGPRQVPVSLEGRLSFSDGTERHVALEAVLMSHRLPARLTPELAEAAPAVFEASFQVIGAHIRAGNLSPDWAQLRSLTAEIWKSDDKPKWFGRNHERASSRLRDLTSLIDEMTPGGIPAGDPDRYGEAIDKALSFTTELERLCQFTVRTARGRRTQARTVGALADECRAAVKRISRLAGVPTPSQSVQSVQVAGLAGAHPEVPGLFSWMLAPHEKPSSAWRVSTTDWRFARGYVMVTDRRLVIVRDDEFAQVGKVDRVRPLTSLAHVSVVDDVGKMGGPDISMKTPKGTLTIQFSDACTREDAETVVRHLQEVGRSTS